MSLVESNSSLPPGWLPRDPDQLWVQCLLTEYETTLLCWPISNTHHTKPRDIMFLNKLDVCDDKTETEWNTMSPAKLTYLPFISQHHLIRWHVHLSQRMTGHCTFSTATTHLCNYLPADVTSACTIFASFQEILKMYLFNHLCNLTPNSPKPPVKYSDVITRHKLSPYTVYYH